MGTNKAEEYADNKYTKQAKEYAITSSIRAIYENCIIDFKEGYNSRQSEIDELTKEVDATFHELEGYKEHNKQLQEEVERLRKERHILLLDFYKGLKNIGRLYSDNTSEEIMMNDVSEFLTTH